MSEQSILPVQALPDGKAEVRLVLQLSWEDVAALGREAGRLAGRLQRPVGFDEAVAHQLRTWTAATSRASKEEPGPSAPSSSRSGVASAPPPMALTVGSQQNDPARHAYQHQEAASVQAMHESRSAGAHSATGTARVSSLSGRGAEQATGTG
jgi:hypothetical protein